jgi:hypothetical protein
MEILAKQIVEKSLDGLGGELRREPPNPRRHDLPRRPKGAFRQRFYILSGPPHPPLSLLSKMRGYFSVDR